MAVAKPLDTLDVCGSEALVVCSCVVLQLCCLFLIAPCLLSLLAGVCSLVGYEAVAPALLCV